MWDAPSRNTPRKYYLVLAAAAECDDNEEENPHKVIVVVKQIAQTHGVVTSLNLI